MQGHKHCSGKQHDFQMQKACEKLIPANSDIILNPNWVTDKKHCTVTVIYNHTYLFIDFLQAPGIKCKAEEMKLFRADTRHYF